ncbi:FUSC family protein [Streptomyces chumphonensis]|uniref:FUSC family protein n=1 Tax=Streptomyces chumphonensis TaxID=1214925 RepID=A0A927EYN6_9ACTN|nr:FUSC family protein [Streptomyces chumphonensis]MBD3931069.1 FUSC family protein [Streptomyces chumphonensis]
MFTAPDPERLRLRQASRAVIGVGLAVLAVAATGLDVRAAITGGLAALLALFTVTDADVRGQAGTTALLPLVGLPVLASAAVLHDAPPLRDAAFLGIVFAGVYARRYGPRGNALGIFAFMTFFVAQFLRPAPQDLPPLAGAVLLALAVAALVRFGLWPIERRTPPPAAPPPGDERGLRRPTTRQAVQATVACGLALLAGQALSHERWYWAVGAAWWIFVNTASRGETLVRGFRRVLGTVVGIAAGLLVALPVDGHPAATAGIVAVCVFGIFYTAAVSYSWMMFFVTVMVGLLYGLLGVLDAGLLALRVAETLIGALGAAAAVVFVLPVTTHATTNAWIRRALVALQRGTEDAARRLAGDAAADPARRVAELELLLGRARLALAPLVHPLNPYRERKARARLVLGLLDECAARAHALAGIAADPEASHDARLTEGCQRVEEAVRRLLRQQAPGAAEDRRADAECAHRQPEGDRAVAHLHALEAALAGLAGPLHSAPRGPLRTA